MNSIIVVLPKPEDGKSIRNLLSRHGYDVTAVCTQGSQVLNYIDMLLLATQRVCSECGDRDIVCVSMPLKVHDLMNTLEMMCMNQTRRRKKLRAKPKQRSEAEKKVLWEAKSILMERNHMTEEEAHRYIQKCSMDSGTSLTETAEMVISMTKI